jgi:hypothetical protein
MPRTYPFEYFDSGMPMLSVLGTFWHKYFDKDPVVHYLKGSAIEAAQRYVHYLEAIASTNRHDVPIFHEEKWYALSIRESALEDGDANLISYDATGTYGGGDRYGVPRATRLYAFQLPNDFSHIGLLLNRIINPSLGWVEGVEYFVQDGVLYMRQNPFDLVEMPKRNIVDSDGNVTDRETMFWCFNVKQDWEHIYEHFGYVISLRLEDSTELYRDVVNAYWDAFTGCLSTHELETLLAALAGVPVVIEETETVEVVSASTRKLVIVTDQHSYRFSPNANAIVSVGDTVTLGQVMVDTVLFYDLASQTGIRDMLLDCILVESVDTVESSSSVISAGKSNVIDPDCPSGYQSSVLALSFGPRYLTGGYLGELTFENKKVTVDYEGTSGNQAIVTFEVGGFATDVEAFWDNVQTNGNLADYWDTRAVKTAAPAANQLPAHVNPLQFVLENILGNNTLVVRYRTASFGVEAAGINALRPLRQVLPPQTTLLVIIEITADDEYYDLDSEVTETVTTHDATPALSETYVMSTSMQETVRVYSALGTCI